MNVPCGVGFLTAGWKRLPAKVTHNSFLRAETSLPGVGFIHDDGDAHCELTAVSSAQKRLTVLAKTTVIMSSSLPPEILDIVVDNLHDEPTTLNACCTVSKSWVPRARRHLFFHVTFSSSSPIGSWMKTFPNPSNSPAHYARVLLLHDLTPITALGTYAHPWLHSFCHIIELQVSAAWKERSVPVPLYGLSPTLKSLSLYLPSAPSAELIDFICSFPLLEDLRLHLHFTNDDTATDGWDAPADSPELTGSLDLSGGGLRPITRRLSGLPNGLHFSRVRMTCMVDDADLTTDLVSQCCDTLESLSISHYPLSAVPSASMIG